MTVFTGLQVSGGYVPPLATHEETDSILFRDFDPNRTAYPIGLDPYGLCQREGAFKPSPIPNILLDAEKTENIPRLIHCIWMGEPMPSARPDYWKNVCDLNRKYRGHGFHLIMWCNESAIDPAFQKMCESEGIVLVNVFDVFRKDELRLESAILYCLQSIPPNYGEASDLLRYNILHRFGGVYLDEDTAGQIMREDTREKPIIVEHWETASQYYMKITTNNPAANDYFVARPKHPFFQKVLDAAELIYQFPLMESYIKGLQQREASLMTHPRFRTIFRTGPGVTFKIWTSSAYKSHMLFETVAEYSWKHSLVKLTSDDMPRVLTTILFHLKETPSTLVLFPFEGLGEEKLWEVVSFLLEHFPEQCASIRKCYTNFPRLFEKIKEMIDVIDDPSDRLLYCM